MSLDDYDRVKVIGKGSYGEVWLAKHKTDKKQYVLKKMDLRKASKKERLASEQEAKLLSDLKHPNIVAYKDTFEGGDGYLYIAMGYCERGDLYARLKEQKGDPLEERQVVEWFVQIAMALQYMHERNILHRDLKTQNIFLTKNKIIKVGDLGIARVLDSSSDMATTQIGTPYYMSPELFSNKPYNFKSDVWALGCCVYEMTTLRHAFNAKDMNALVYRVLRGKLPPMPETYRKELVDLIKAMLNKNPDKRPSVNRILRDPYIKENIAIFLEGTKSNTNLNRRPGSANKKDRPSSRDGNRPRRPKPEPQNLEPLNTGPDVLEPIKEEPTPRDSMEVPSSLSDHQKNSTKDSSDANDGGPLKAKSEKNNSGRDGVGSSSEVLPPSSAMNADVEKPKRLSSVASKSRERRSSKNSKLSKKNIVTNAADESKGSAQEIEVFLPPNKVDQTDLVSISPATNEKAAVVVYRHFSADDSSNSVGSSGENVRPSPPRRKSSSSRSKPPLPESRSSVPDLISLLSEPNSPVIKSPSSDFGLAKDESPSLMPERKSTKSELRSSPLDSKPPVPACSRSSAPMPCPSKCESSPCASGTSVSKPRYSPSRHKSAESDACLTEKQKSELKCRPLPPRPTSSSINPEPSKAINYKSSKTNQANGDSGRSSSTSSSGYSGREEVGDQMDDRASENVSRSSQEMPVPMRSIESSARQRRRIQQQQQQQQTPRISRSVDVTLCPPESLHDRVSSNVTSNYSSRQERHFKSVDCENRNSRPGGEKKPLKNHPDQLGSEPEKRGIRCLSNGIGSSSEDDEEESTSKAEQREEKKEIDSFISLLGTTLRLQRKSKDSDDEGDSGVEAIPEVSKPNKARNNVCGATYLIPAPSPLPPGAKYPYIDESSVPISARNRHVHHRLRDESPYLNIPDKAVDPLDSAISMTTTGRLFDRITVLRKDCIRALGVEKLKIAYDILDCFDTDEIEPQLVKLLGKEDFDGYAGKIFQLKFCEESAFKAQ